MKASASKHTRTTSSLATSPTMPNVGKTPLGSPTRSTLFTHGYTTTVPSPKSGTPVKFNLIKLDRWILNKFEDLPEVDDSKHNLINDEDVVNQEAESGDKSPTSQGQEGPEAVKGFYSEYKNITKAISPFHYKDKSPAYEYLKEIELVRQIPRPMGIVKWRGPPSELNLK